MLHLKIQSCLYIAGEVQSIWYFVIVYLPYFRSPPNKVVHETIIDQAYIDNILCRHAKMLLSTNRLRDLGYFAANIKEFSLIGFLKKERWV